MRYYWTADEVATYLSERDDACLPAWANRLFRSHQKKVINLSYNEHEAAQGSARSITPLGPQRDHACYYTRDCTTLRAVLVRPMRKHGKKTSAAVCFSLLLIILLMHKDTIMPFPEQGPMKKCGH